MAEEEIMFLEAIDVFCVHEISCFFFALNFVEKSNWTVCLACIQICRFSNKSPVRISVPTISYYVNFKRIFV